MAMNRSSATPDTTVLVTGNTFSVKDQLKAMGGRWDAAAKGWRVPASKADEARALVSGAKRSGRTAATGKCCKCGVTLSDWERRHGIRCCLDCRDGGSRARGGASYYDRNGNFVLGDDD